MGKITLFLFFSLVLASCASTPQRGKNLRMDAEIQESEEHLARVDDPKAVPLALQVTKAVSTGEEDAAVFNFSMAQAYSLDNDPQKSIEAYRAALVHDPKSALLRARLASELVKTGSFAEAKILCLESLEIDSKFMDSYLLLAGIQVAAKEYQAALATYSKSLKVDGENRDALLYYGVTLAEVGKTKEGIQQLEHLVKLKDVADSGIDRAVGYYYLAKVYEQASKVDSAVHALKQALNFRPGFGKAALALADLYVGMHEEEKAYAALEDAFRESHAVEIAERLSETYLSRNQFKKAVPFLEAMIEEDPSNENAKLRLALVYWELKWLDKAKFLLTDLSERYPTSSEISFYMGELEVERQNLDGAMVYYKRVAADFGKYDRMVGHVVSVFRDQKRFAEAETFLQDALAKRPDAVAFYPLLAAIYEDQKRLADGVLALERGRKKFPQDENVLYYLGFLYDRVGDHGKALSTMEELLKVNGNNANALNFVGYALVESNGDLARAEKLLARAKTLKPGDAFVLDSYGWLLYRRGKQREGMKELEKAYAAAPEEGVIGEHLADIYVSLDFPQKALAIYQRALNTAGGDQEFIARVETKIGNVQRALAEAPRPSTVLGERKPASVR